MSGEKNTQEIGTIWRVCSVNGGLRVWSEYILKQEDEYRQPLSFMKSNSNRAQERKSQKEPPTSTKTCKVGNLGGHKQWLSLILSSSLHSSLDRKTREAQ